MVSLSYLNPLCFNLLRVSQEPETLVELVLSIAFASPEELGWDPTIQPVFDSERRNGPGICWKITVNVGDDLQAFTADEIISDVGAQALCGRGSRIFRAYDSKGVRVILKDSWREEDTESEGDVLDDIMGQLKLIVADEEMLVARQALFLTTRCHGDVLLGSPGSPKADSTLDHIMKQHDVTGAQAMRWDTAVSTTPAKPVVCSVGQHSLVHVPASSRMVWALTNTGETPENYRMHHRVHYRIVFEEEGVPLHECSNRQDYYRGLRDASLGASVQLSIFTELSDGDESCVA